jgi:hypothetical protein
VKSCKFQELDYTDFLSEILSLGTETNPRNRTIQIREVYKTYVSDSSPTFLPFPKSIITKIQSRIESRTLTNDIYEESSVWVSEQLLNIVNDYYHNNQTNLRSPQASSTSDSSPGSPISNNLDFFSAVSHFKANYISKTNTERQEDANVIVTKFLYGEKSNIFVKNKEQVAEVLKTIKLGGLKIDTFDKLVSDIASDVLKPCTSNITKPLPQSRISTPKRDALTTSDTSKLPVFIRVTDRDPKTSRVIGRLWRLHFYKLNEIGSKLICYISLNNTADIPEFTIEFSKLNSLEDIFETDQFSEPENEKYVWSIMPLKLLFACSTTEARTLWINYLHTKLLEYKKIISTPSVVASVPKTNSFVGTEESLLTSGEKRESFSVVLRRYNRRGGVRVPVPDTMEKLVMLASEKLNIKVERIREIETEAELTDLSLLKPNMLVWVMTADEELEFV